MAEPNPGMAEAVSAPVNPTTSRPDELTATAEPDAGGKKAEAAILSDPMPAIATQNDIAPAATEDHGNTDDHHRRPSTAEQRAADTLPAASAAAVSRNTSRGGSVALQMTPSREKTRSASSSSENGDDDGSSGSSNASLSEKGGSSKKKKKAKKGGDGDGTAKKVGFKELFRYATKWDIFFNSCGIIAAAVAGAAQPLMTIVFGNLTTAFLEFSNAAAGKGDIDVARRHLDDEVLRGVLFLIYIGIAMFAATYIYMASWVYSGEAITRRIREKYLQAVLRQDISYFDILGAGEITTRIQTDIQLIQEGISDKIPISVTFIAAFVAGFAVAYSRSWKLALVMTSIIPCIIAAGIAMNAVVAKLQQSELDHVSKAASIAEESLATVRTAKAFGVEGKLVNLYHDLNRRATRVGVRKAMVQGAGLGVFFFIIYSGYALAFYFGGKLVASGEIAAGVVMNVIFSILIGAFSMAMMAPNMQALSYAFGAGAKVFETIDRVPAIDSADPSGLKPDSCHGELTFTGIEFSYPARPDVTILDNFNLTVPAGKVTALVGASGSGKSTIVSLVERFYDPLAGVAALDGIDLKSLNLKWLRTQIGLVSQEPTLFATDIRGNIAHGLINTPFEHASAEEKEALVVEAAKKANAHGFISQLPEGYKTMVGERGFLLSGGQKQRIAIARAIVKNPRILLLDEATSALDTQSEAVVQDALEKASEGRTTITIAHRLSTIKTADKIVVMGKGVILETGTHESLLAAAGPYAQLVDSQRIRANVDSQNLYESDDFSAAGNADDAGLALKGQLSRGEKDAIREEAKAEMPAGLDRAMSKQSVTSAILAKREADRDTGSEKVPSIFWLLYRLALVNRDQLVRLYLPGVIASIASGAAYPAFSILFGRALENYSLCSGGGRCPEPQRSTMLAGSEKWALYFFVIAILSSVAIAIQTNTLMLASSILMERLRRLSFAAYLRADVHYHDEDGHSSGSLSNSLADNSQKINGLVGVTLGTIIQSLSTLLTGSIIALIYGWKLALVVIACIPLTLSAGFFRLKLVVLKDAKIKKAHSGSAQRACEAASAIRTVASLTREDNCLEIYREELREPGRISRNTALYGNALYSLSQALSFWVISLGFWYGSQLLRTGEYGSGQFFTIFTAVVFGSIQAGNVFNFVPDISNAKTAAWDSIKLLDMVPEIDSESSEGKVLDQVAGHVQLQDVHFRYPTRTSVRVLRGLTLDIKPGTYCALVGGSGCGKSTTIQLIQRFYDTVSGSVKIDGHDLTELNLKEIRKHMALVSQEPTLYDGTIEFNIRLGAFEDADTVTKEQLREAAAQANILSFIESLPDKWDTEVGGKGTQLSGGQKQRIAIARALIRNPKILLLDEATSALDSDSEKVVQEALDKASRGRTTIAIAHRLSTISRADRIFCLKDGVVAEAGDHKTLMAKKGIYADLVQMQELQKEQ
ncbi:probable Leptomycin B resistance protein pmd1 [Pseudozyma flocculosa]|nr:probable Leptomycin B resistance protein pmd1 [Pseudozyma flocculosa]